MILALIIVFVIGGTFFFLWQDEHEKRIEAEKQIKDLKRQLKRGQKQGQKQSQKQSQKQRKATKDSSGFATIEKSEGTHGYEIKKPQPQVSKPLLDQEKLVELQMQTRASQDMLAEIFDQEEETSTEAITRSDDERMLDMLRRLFDKEVWTRAEIAELAGPEVMIGSLLEQINDYSCSKIDDIVVEEDDDKIYVAIEYKEHLI